MTFSFKKTRSLIAISTLGIALTLAGCSDDDTDNSDLRVMHTSKDAPPVNVNVDSRTVIADLDYAESSGYISVRSGTKNIVVEGIIPGGNADVISVDRFAFVKDMRYTILAINDVASIDALVVEESASEPSNSEVAVAVVHASTNAGEVDVYVTAPDVDVAAASPAFTFNQGDVIDAGALPATSYRIQVTAKGLKTPVVYDSGTVDLSGFAGDKVILAAISSTTQTELDTSPVKLLAANDSALLVIPDARTQAGARVVHLSPDAGTVAAGPVNVFATTDGVTVELIPAFEYTDVVPDQTADNYIGVAPGDYVFDVAPATAPIGAAVYTSPSIPLGSANEYTAIAAGNVAVAPAFELLATLDDNRPIATQASVKVIHAAPAAGDVNVFVTPSKPKFTTADVESGAAGDPLLSDFEYGTITDYVALPPGKYDIRVVPVGGVTAINIEGFELTGGQVATIIARQPDGDGNPATFGVVVLTN